MINIRNRAFIKKFGERLREIREEKKMTQDELAYNANISANQVGRIERGEVNTTISTIQALSQALQVNPVEFFNFKLK